jgi:hypothetical protein
MAEDRLEHPMHPTTDLAGAQAHVRAAEAGAPKKVSNADIREQIHGSSPVGRFNNRLALAITKTVGTMWVAYLFALLALVSLPAAIASGNTIVIVGWIAQTFLQLVLLPIIIVGQNVISGHQEARADADHNTLTALHSINVHQLEILETQQHILEKLERAEARRAA